MIVSYVVPPNFVYMFLFIIFILIFLNCAPLCSHMLKVSSVLLTIYSILSAEMNYLGYLRKLGMCQHFNLRCLYTASNPCTSLTVWFPTQLLFLGNKKLIFFYPSKFLADVPPVINRQINKRKNRSLIICVPPLYMGNTQENWVTPQMAKYHLQLKRKEGVCRRGEMGGGAGQGRLPGKAQ